MTLAAAGSETASAYLELGAALVVLAVAARIASHLELSPVPLYLLGGIGLGLADPPQLTGEFVELTANLGVILLLFVLGLEYTADELRANLRAHAPAGLVDAALNFLPGFVLASLLGWGTLEALVLGGVTWVSSSGIIAKAIADLGRLGSRETPAILSVLVTEDLLLVVFLPVLGALLVGGGVLAALGSLGLAALAAGTTLVAALRHGERIGRLVAHRSDEVVLLSSLGIVLLVAGVAERMQVSAAVAAFLVGIALSGEVAHQTRTLLTPLRDFAAAVFFLFFGLSIDVETIPGVLLPALGLAAFTALTKMVTGWWAARRAGVDRLGRARGAAALVAHGEFSIVLAGIGVGAGLDEELGALAAAYVLVMASAGPILMRYADLLLPLIDLLDRSLGARVFRSVAARVPSA